MKVIAVQNETGSKKQFMEDVEKAVSIGKTCLISPDKTEAVCFDAQEILTLTSELSSGKISLIYLAENLGLSGYQLHYVVAELLKAGQVKGELTYNTFTSASMTRLLSLKKSKAQKHEHRRKMIAKRK